jgi:hypothetical protein
LSFGESVVREAVLTSLELLGWTVKDDSEVASGELAAVMQACLAKRSGEETWRQ